MRLLSLFITPEKVGLWLSVPFRYDCSGYNMFALYSFGSYSTSSMACSSPLDMLIPLLRDVYVFALQAIESLSRTRHLSRFTY